MSGLHTPGPWFTDRTGNIWRRDPADLYQNGGSVAGDKPIAGAYQGWHGEGDKGYPAEANARLIASAPELLEALVGCVEHMEHSTPQGRAAWVNARAAIAKATGAAP